VCFFVCYYHSNSIFSELCVMTISTVELGFNFGTRCGTDNRSNKQWVKLGRPRSVVFTGIAMRMSSVRPPVRLSVTLMACRPNHIVLHWKRISRINMVILHLLRILTSSENSKGNFVKFGGELLWVGKNHVLPVTRHIIETVRDRGLVTMDHLGLYEITRFLFASSDTFITFTSPTG